AQNVQRVAPNGSAVATPVTTRGVKRNRCHGGGPALGALNGAVKASPATSAGQPPSRNRPAINSSVGPSVTVPAAPSRTGAMPPKGDGAGAGGGGGKAARLEHRGPAREVEAAGLPQAADARRVRLPVRPDRAQEERDGGGRRAGHEGVTGPAPEEGREAGGGGGGHLGRVRRGHRVHLRLSAR